VLRFVTCGNVGDGKSTLIGRLLHEAKLLSEDRLAALGADPTKFGTQGGDPEFAPYTDGLNAEREHDIISDVAYHYFSTARRNFNVADTPGREQYTRDLVTAALTANVAVILIDAREGMRPQTRRHSYLVSLLGIRRVALAIDRLDLVGYSKEVFDRIEAEYRAFAKQIGLEDIVCIPLSALKGDNVTAPSAHTPWYDGPTLLDYLETVVVGDDVRSLPFRMPVQSVDQHEPASRGFSGRVVGGSIRRGDRVRVLPSGKESTVARIVSRNGDLEQAVAGQSIALTLDDEIDIRRGDLLAAVDSPPGVADQFEAAVIWMSEDEMLPGRRYLLKIGARAVGVSIATPKYKVNVDTLEHLAAKTLRLDEIGVCNLHLDQTIAFDPYAENRDTGSFILIDRMTNDMVAAGLLHFALRRSQNIHWQAIEINKQAHAALNGQKPCVVWFTGLSGSGKSTIANVVEKKLHAMGRHTYLLDGDNVRHGLNKDLGFTEADRVENIRRVAEVARLMADAGLIVLVSFISPFRAERRLARALVQQDEFCEVFVDTPLSVAEQRDTKGLYKKARCGELKNFTGIDSPYEPPEHAEVRIDTVATAPEDAGEVIVARLRGMGVLDPP
jgi:bifunctional enzyme CysN/CysC